MMECDDCFDYRVHDLALAPELVFAARKMRVSMMLPRGESLCPALANPTTSGDELTFTSMAEVWAPSSAPPPDAVHRACEFEPTSPATIVIDAKAACAWTARYTTARRVCCDMPRRHGPQGCGGERMDCITTDL